VVRLAAYGKDGSGVTGQFEIASVLAICDLASSIVPNGRRHLKMWGRNRESCLANPMFAFHGQAVH
jgi:hypothetical protein